MIRRTLRGLAALAALAALLAGWPAALLAAGRAAAAWLPDLSDPLAVLAGPDAGGLFLLLVLALGWAAWAVWATAVLVEAAAQIRGVPTPRLGGLFPQHSAAALVTAIAVAFSTGPGTALADLSAPAPPAAAAEAAIGAEAAATGTPVAQDAGPGQQEAEKGVRDYTVMQGDTMWDIAGDQLADPMRWPEIADASHDIPQPGGRTITDPDLILPGWTLHIPAPTGDPEPAPAETPPPAAGPGTVPGSGTGPPSEPVLPSTPLQTPGPGAAQSPPVGTGAAPAARPLAEGPDAGAAVPLPVTPLRPPAPAGAEGLPATPMAAGREDAPPHDWAIDDEGRAGPGHGVLGVPDWITDPLAPTSPADAPDLVAALATAP